MQEYNQIYLTFSIGAALAYFYNFLSLTVASGNTRAPTPSTAQLRNPILTSSSSFSVLGLAERRSSMSLLGARGYCSGAGRQAGVRHKSPSPVCNHLEYCSVCAYRRLVHISGVTKFPGKTTKNFASIASNRLLCLPDLPSSPNRPAG